MSRSDQILAAIRSGHVTAPLIAREIGISRNNAAVRLHRMKDMGLVRPGRVVAEGPGRPPIQWSVA